MSEGVDKSARTNSIQVWLSMSSNWGWRPTILSQIMFSSHLMSNLVAVLAGGQLIGDALERVVGESEGGEGLWVREEENCLSDHFVKCSQPHFWRSSLPLQCCVPGWSWSRAQSLSASSLLLTASTANLSRPFSTPLTGTFPWSSPGPRPYTYSPRSRAVLVDTLLILSNLARVSRDHYAPLESSQTLRFLSPLIRHKDAAVRARVCNLVGNMCRHSDFFYQSLVECVFDIFRVHCVTLRLAAQIFCS